MKKNIVIGALMLIVGIVGGWLCRGCFHADKTLIVQRDTLVRVDTIIEKNPILIKEEVIDTMLVVLRDTIRLRDTLFLSLPLEKKIYASGEYYAEVSGYRPNLDYIEVFPKTRVITERIKEQPNKWRFSLDAGVDIGKGSQAYMSPNIGAEIGYKKWSITAEAGLDVSVAKDVIPYYQMGLRFAIIQR